MAKRSSGTVQRGRISYRPGAFGKWLQAERIRADLTQEQLGKLTGGAVDQSDISRFQRGRSDNPSLTTVIALARALHLSLGDLEGLAAAMMPIAAAPPRAVETESRLPQELGLWMRTMQDQVDGIAGVVERMAGEKPGTSRQGARKAVIGGRRRR